MKLILNCLSSILMALVVSVALTNCSSSNDSTPTTSSYQGAGSKWSASFTGGSFTINHFADVSDTSPDMVVNGTYVDYTSGFRLLTVSSSTGTGGPSAGDQAYGFEVPGFAFFLKPVDGDGEPIVMIEAGECPTSGFNANWITASFDPGATLNASMDSFGYAAFTLSGASSTATIYQYEAEGGTSLGSNAISFDYTSCSNGVLSFSPGGAENVDMFFTSSGGALVHTYNGTTHDGIIFAAPKNSTAVTQSAMADTYSVLVFDDNSATDKLFPGKLVIPSSGTATFQKIEDVSTDTLSADPAVDITSIAANAASPGLFHAVIDAAGTNGRMSCTYIPVSSTKIIACNGYAQNADRTKPFFLLGKSR